jgi:hypothetical protein
MVARRKRAKRRKPALRKPSRAARKPRGAARGRAGNKRAGSKRERSVRKSRRTAAKPKRRAAKPARAELARLILALAPRLELADRHERGVAAAATARRNVEDTAAGGRATRGSAAGSTQGAVDLALPVLAALVALAERGYRLRVCELAGGIHRPDSPHYAGAAFSVDRLNGRSVEPRHPDVGRFRDDCRRLGAVRVLGPGVRGHESHVQAAWPRSPLP